MIGGVEMFRDLSDVAELRRQLKATYTIEDIVSKSAAMRRVRDMLPLVARSDSTVLIEGEPGTGKELVARAIHNLGARSAQARSSRSTAAPSRTPSSSRSCSATCAAPSPTPRSDKPGRFALAQGGTLLLDEVGELSPAIQVKLLRVLQEREFTPLGAVQPVKADVRILAATNRDLAVEVMNRRFRQDLYFRLNVVRIDPAAAARAGPRTSRSWCSTSSRASTRLQGRRIVGHLRDGDGAPARPLLPRQRARARERDRARLRRLRRRHVIEVCRPAVPDRARRP